MITRDPDFLKLHSKGVRHSGIVFLTKPLSTSEIIRGIQKVSLIFESLENAVVFIPMKI